MAGWRSDVRGEGEGKIWMGKIVDFVVSALHM
jgi:hypothetical protein